MQLVFFDGEEAFKEWTDTDSLYGARHLANKWKSTKSFSKTKNIEVREVDKISALVLLDLIGAPNQKFYSFYENTESLHGRLVQIERALFKMGLMEGRNFMFIPRSHSGGACKYFLLFLTFWFLVVIFYY